MKLPLQQQTQLPPERELHQNTTLRDREILVKLLDRLITCQGGLWCQLAAIDIVALPEADFPETVAQRSGIVSPRVGGLDRAGGTDPENPVSFARQARRDLLWALK